MARGNRIVVSANPQGKWVEGFIGAGITPKPGTVMQIDHTVALKGGRHTWVVYNADGDGHRPKGPVIVLIENYLLGQVASVAYAAGDRAFGYIPEGGDELNMLVKNETGTADDHSAGEMMVPDDTTGLLVVSPGSAEQTEMFQLNEAITDPTADTLAWCTYTGH